MHRHYHVWIELFDLGDDVPRIVHRRRPEMEAADQGMDLLDAGRFLRLLHRIDDAAMAARRYHDKAAILHVEDRGVLVIVFIGNGLA